MSNPAPLDQQWQAFLSEPHVAMFSVASDDDRPPHTVPLFYHYEPYGNITFFTGTQGRTARKTRLIEIAGKVSLCVQKEDFPYKYVTVEGTAIGIDRPPTEDQLLAIARRYMPEDAAREFVHGELNDPKSRILVFTIRPDRWLTSSFAEGDGG